MVWRTPHRLEHEAPAMPDPALHHALRTRREAIGMSRERLAHILGLSAMSLYDLEAYADEWHTVTPFATVMTACRLLGIDLLAHIPPTDREPIIGRTAPGDAIRHFRERRGLTLDAFAGRVGIAIAGATAIEIGDCLTLWPFDVTAFVADALAIDCRSFVEKTMWTRA